MRFGWDPNPKTWNFKFWRSQNGWWQLDLGPFYIYGERRNNRY